MSRLDLADGLRLLHSLKGGGHFGHEGHLRFGWALLTEADDVDDAERVATLTIRHVAELAGNPTKYNCTMTLFWIRMLAHVRDQHSGVSSLEEALDAFPALADSNLPDRYWSDVNSEEARSHWVDPDLLPLP